MLIAGLFETTIVSYRMKHASIIELCFEYSQPLVAQNVHLSWLFHLMSACLMAKENARRA
jgi:hypothetical protein